MKLVHIIRSLDPGGGGPREFVLRSTDVLASQGHDIRIVSLDAHDAGCVRQLQQQKYDVVGVGDRSEGYAFSRGATARIGPEIAACDAVLIHGLWQYHVLSGSAAARNDGKPYFVFAHGMLDPWFQKTFPAKALKKQIYWLLFEHRALRKARSLCFTCEEERRLASDAFWPWGLRETVLPFGTVDPGVETSDWDRRAFFERFSNLAHSNFLLFLGRLHPKKGCDILLEAFARTGGALFSHLVFAGGGDPAYVATLQTMTERLGLSEKVIFTGPLDGEVKWGALRAAAAFILPSHQENFGIAVVESLACGTPVMISDKVNIHCEISADGAGLVEPDTLAGVERLLQQYSGLSDITRKTMGEAARRSFCQRYDLSRSMGTMVDSILALCA